MKTKVKKVYYCDYCKKKGLSASAMSKHEKHCTGNSDRECRMCGNQHDYSLIIKGFNKRYKIVRDDTLNFVDLSMDKIEWIGKPITLDEIHDITEGCPACTLTIMRLSGLNDWLFNDVLHFDYIEEVKKWWAEVNKEMAKQNEMSTYY